MLVALNTIAASQAIATSVVLAKCRRLLDYATTYQNAILRYHASDMVLHIDSDAAYLVMPGTKSRIAGHFFLSNRPPMALSKVTPLPNGAILTKYRTLRHVVASAAEAETSGIFLNAQVAIPIRLALKALGHPQPSTPIKTDNSTSHHFVHTTMRKKRSKSSDIRLNWLRDRETYSQFHVYWEKGTENGADYFTKHHSPQYHQKMRPKYVHSLNIIKDIVSAAVTDHVRGCVYPISQLDTDRSHVFASARA